MIFVFCLEIGKSLFDIPQLKHLLLLLLLLIIVVIYWCVCVCVCLHSAAGLSFEARVGASGAGGKPIRGMMVVPQRFKVVLLPTGGLLERGIPSG